MPTLSELREEFESGAVFVAFDTETTGLSPAACRLTEIGAVKFDRRGIIARFGTLVDPGVPIPAEVVAITGITDEMVRGKPEPGAAAEDFLQFCGDAPLVAHNARFDTSFLSAALAENGKSPPENPVLDTRTLAKRAFPNLESYALQKLAAVLGIGVHAAHRADDDARVCMGCSSAACGKTELSRKKKRPDFDLKTSRPLIRAGLWRDRRGNLSCKP